MHIEFRQIITGTDALEGYITPGKSRPRGKNKYIQFDYELDTLRSENFDSIHSSFKEGGYKLKRTSTGSIWVSKPESFSLDFYVSSPYRSIYSGWDDENFEMVGFEPGSFRKKIKLYQEIPRVTLAGNVYYNNLTGVDPLPVLEVLDALGYVTTVYTTAQELEAGINNSKKKGKKLLQLYLK
jgi:hypothetical protein